MTHLASQTVFAGLRWCLSSARTVVSHGMSYITHLMAVNIQSQIIEETYVRYATVGVIQMEMDREELINRVNDMTAGNRHDYLTRKDVEQIVDATLVAQGDVPEPDGLPEADPTATEPE